MFFGSSTWFLGYICGVVLISVGHFLGAISDW